MRPVAETHPYRNRVTGLIQDIPDDAAAVFGDQYERLPDDYQAVLDERDGAVAEAKAIAKTSPRKPAAKQAKGRAAAATKAAEKIETPTVAPSEVETPNGD